MVEAKMHLRYLNPLPCFVVQAGVSGLDLEELLTEGWAVYNTNGGSNLCFVIRLT